MTDNGRCVRCFQGETILHLLLDCRYTREVWGRLGLQFDTPEDIIHGGISQCVLEIREEFIIALVLRKKTIQPEAQTKAIYSFFEEG
jgi:hypothetical protein